MTVYTKDFIRWTLTFALSVFHCSVIYLILCMKYFAKNKMYSSSFYLLYLMISFADIGAIIINFLSEKIILIDSWKPWFFAHPEWDTILWLISGYLIYFQSILHSSIAINRAWIAFSFFVKNNDFLPKFGTKFIWLLPVIPVGIIALRFLRHSVYFFTVDGELAMYYNETYIAMYHSIAGPIVVLSTSTISFILAMATIIRYKYLFKQYKNVSSTMKQDMLLFSHAFVVLIFQLALVSYFIMRLIATSQKLPELQVFALFWFGFISDASSLINPIALLLLCKFIREDYINFVILRRQNQQQPNEAAITGLKNNSVAQQRLQTLMNLSS